MAERRDIGGKSDIRRKAEGRGRRGEWLAALLLMAKGYRIIARNYRTPLGEIDLIARRGTLVAFVEVKARRTLVSAMEAVSPASERRIQTAAALWLARHRDHHNLSLRFDIIAIQPWRLPVHVENAWQGRN